MILQYTSPVVLAREFLWRARKRWNQRSFREQIREGHCPVHFRNIGYYAPRLEACTKASRACILGAADAFCRGEVPFFGYGTIPLGFPPPWNLDFVSGKSWELVPSERLILVRDDGSDVKVPWELSRLQLLPVLGKAYRLTTDARYRDAAKNVLSDWIERNPVGWGVNWAVAMEAALRAMSICFLLDLLWPFGSGEAGWLEKATLCLWQHLLYIEAHLEFSHLVRSNHYLSNVLGLFGLSLFLEGQGMERRRLKNRHCLEREILEQVYEDGGDYEASTGYHVLVTQMFTCALLLMRAVGISPAPDFVSRLRKMYRLIAALADSRGELPHVGDCDDGRVELLLGDLEQMLFLPPQQRNSLRVSGLLGIGEALGGDPLGGRPDDAVWYGLQQSNQFDRRRGQGTPSRQASIVFPKTGIAIASSPEVEVLFLALPNGIEGKGSHTHNDKLSIVVRICGEELLCDSGTCFYTRDAAVRNRFRSTAAHNTIVVDQREQSRIPAGRKALFQLGTEAKVSPIQAEEGEGVSTLRASHDGYKEYGVTHTRTVHLAAKQELTIEDWLTGSGRHQFEAHFHLAPPWMVASLETIGNQVRCRIVGPHPITVELDAAVQLRARQEAAHISRTYGACFPASEICVSAESFLPFRLTTRIRREPAERT